MLPTIGGIKTPKKIYNSFILLYTYSNTLNRGELFRNIILLNNI